MNDLTEFQNSDGHWISEAAHKQALAEKDQAYQQLIEQAVRFAESVVAYDPYHDGKLKKEARVFLKERDLEADPFGATMKQFYKEREGT